MSQMFTDTRERCDPGQHNLVGDGTCTLCTSSAHDIDAEPIRSPMARATR